MRGDGRWPEFLLWALGISVLCLIGALALNYRLVTQRLDALESLGSPAIRERVATLERSMLAIQVSQDRLEVALDRNGAKLDRIVDTLLEHERRTTGARK